MGMVDGKVAIVTGSGRGIGAASAKKLAAEGASVVISDIDPTPAEESVAAIRTRKAYRLALRRDARWSKYMLTRYCPGGSDD